MPLSEHEQRLLEQIERSLLDEDPKFASAVRASDPRHHAFRKVIWAGLLFVLGVGVLVLGLVTKIAPGGVPVVALCGFLTMFLAAVLAVQAYRRVGRPEMRAAATDVDSAPKRPKARSGRMSILDRLEQRWRRRHDDRG